MQKAAKQIWAVSRLPEMVVEEFGGLEYAYIPLGKYVVAARGVCGGRPTIKYTRLDARHVIGMLNAGESPERIARNHKISTAAITEAMELSGIYDYELRYA
ncbi:MAG: DUF433 domain-containing protein [Blastocatellia bacterium]